MIDLLTTFCLCYVSSINQDWSEEKLFKDSLRPLGFSGCFKWDKVTHTLPLSQNMMATQL